MDTGVDWESRLKELLDTLGVTKPPVAVPMTPLAVQVGGDHYAKYAIEPIDYIVRNNLSFLQGNVIKYVTRYKDKGGKQDLEKAKHYIDLILYYEYAQG